MDRYDHYTDKFITDPHDTQYGILGTNLAEVGTMTNAEAIDVIRDYLVNKVDNEPMQKACQLAIKALSAEPQYHNTVDGGLHKHYEHYNGMEKLLAEPQERKTGKWVWSDGVRCSNCNHKVQTTGLPTVCPNCGSYNRGGA